MPLGTPGYWFNQTTVDVSAPASAGVYGIYVPNADSYVYIGQSEDIQARLTQHLGDTTHCMHGYSQPAQGARLAFTVELVAGGEQARLARELALLKQWNPPCNQT